MLITTKFAAGGPRDMSVVVSVEECHMPGWNIASVRSPIAQYPTLVIMASQP